MPTRQVHRKTRTEPPAEQPKISAKAPAEAVCNPAWARLALGIRTKLEVGAPGDPFEREADRVADQVMRMPEPRLRRAGAAYRNRPEPCPNCEDESGILRKADAAGEPAAAPTDRVGGLGEGHPFDPRARAFFEPRFGQDFGNVRVHTGTRADSVVRSVNALAFTLGHQIAFRSGRYAPRSETGRRLLAHELTHIVQQGRSGLGHGQGTRIQREAARPDPLTVPLTDREWQRIYFWLSRGEVGIDPLTGDPEHNADLVSEAIFCERMLGIPGFGEGEDPLLCLEMEVTRADPRVRMLKRHVTARGPIIHWPAVPTANRLVYVMDLLVDTHHYPVNAAAGIVGNLLAESRVLPSMIQGSPEATPMRGRGFTGRVEYFSPEEVMGRSETTRVGPRSPGIGLAQWTSEPRRSRLFQRVSGGRPLGSSILFEMDAQVEYLVSELRANAGLNTRLTAAGVTLNDASDNVCYENLIPHSILDASNHKLPRADPAVQTVFAARRANGRRALRAYQAAHSP